MEKVMVRVQYKCGHKELIPIAATRNHDTFALQQAAKRFVCPQCRRDMR